MNDATSIQAGLVSRAKLELKHSRTEEDVKKRVLRSHRLIMFSTIVVCLMLIVVCFLVILDVKPFDKYPLHLTREGTITNNKIIYNDTNYGTSNKIELDINQYLDGNNYQNDDKVKVILDKDGNVKDVLTKKEYDNYIKYIAILIVGLLGGSIVILIIFFIIESKTYGKYWHEYYKWWLHVGFYKTDRYIQ